MIRYFFSILSLITVCTLATAQNFYAVQVGVFLNPRISDFESVRSLGFLYAEEDEGSVYRIFLGDFDDPKIATRMEQSLKNKGYMDAKVVQRTTGFGQSTPVIQMATRSPKEQIEWADFYKVGEVYVLAEKGQIKLVTGIYTDIDQAQKDLARVRQLGYKDAFPKTVNSARLHKPTAFELGDYKRPLIPIDLGSGEEDFGKKGKAEEPVRKGIPIEPGEPTLANSLPLPKIRTNVKRRSALDLQKALRSMNAYPGALDGNYGNGTKTGFTAATSSNQQFQKYKILAKYSPTINQANDRARISNLQLAINELWFNPADAYAVLDKLNHPLAKAYKSYWSFKNSGASNMVNSLMNQAISEGFRRTSNAARPPIDPLATYAYNDYGQLVRHITFLHQVQTDVVMPCWLMERHATEIRSAMASSPLAANVSKDCSNFYQWEIVKVLLSTAQDMSGSEIEAERISAKLSQLYLVPTQVSQAEADGLLSWNELLWQGLNTWSGLDPLHKKMVDALKLSYFQTQVLLEDYYMDKGFSVAQAQALSLAAIKEIVGEHLERFV